MEIKQIIKLFDIPKEIIKDNERQRRVYSITGISPTVLGRTDQGKLLRKDYESHKIHHGFNEHRLMEIGNTICNSITTVQKDYLICEQFSIT